MWWLLGLACTRGQLDTAQTDVMFNDVVYDEQTYQFYRDERETVSYTGQTLRHLLLHDVQYRIELAREGQGVPSGQLEQDLLFYIDTIKDFAEPIPHLFSIEGVTLVQENYSDLSTGKNLLEKMAGHDVVTDYQDWSADFIGWNGASPEQLLRTWIAEMDALQVSGEPSPLLFENLDGLNLDVLVHTLLWGAVQYSQATDDYLSEDVDGKGLRSSHFLTEDAPYSELEHAWDEAFGYVGLPASYVTWGSLPAETIAVDQDDSATIDLRTEVYWKRVHGLFTTENSNQEALHQKIWQAFWDGRKLLAETAGRALTEEEMDDLKRYRDTIVSEWDRLLLQQLLASIETMKQSLENSELEPMAREWSLLKGLALSVQFSPYAQLQGETLETFHELLGTTVPEESEMQEVLGNLEAIIQDIDGLERR